MSSFTLRRSGDHQTRPDDTLSRRWQFEDAAEPDHPISTQSLPSGGTAGPSLWRAVRDRIEVTNTFRQTDRRIGHTDLDGRIDAEGLSTDTVRSRDSGSTLPGRHAEHWQSLAHLFDDQDSSNGTAREQRGRRRRRPSSGARRVSSRQRTSQHALLESQDETEEEDSHVSSNAVSSRTSPSPYREGSQAVIIEQPLPSGRSIAMPLKRKSIVTWNRMVPPPPRGHDAASRLESIGAASLSEEPSSWLRDDPDDAPEGEDPLQYSNQAALLDSDTESSASGSSDSDTDATDVGRLPPIEEVDDGPAAKSDVATLPARVRLVALKRGLQGWWHPTPMQKSIAKCAIAYGIASLFTYSSFLSSHMAKLLPNRDPDVMVPFSSLHLTATVAVYFHPAKTLGAMLEADFFALIAFLYSVLLGFTSMAIAVFFHDADMLFVSDIFSVLIFLGIGMAIVGYAKVKVGKPQFNTACSLVSIIVFTVVVKEGSKHLGHFSIDKTFQVTLVVIAGSLVSNLVCFLVWPQSATTNLQQDINTNLRGFATLLRVLTKTFLLDDPSNFHFKSDRIKKAIDDHHGSFTSLKKNLEEAVLESAFDLRMRGMRSKYVEAISSMTRLAQHLAGLRSSCGLQHDIMMARLHARKSRQAGGHDGLESAPLHEQQPGSISHKHLAEAVAQMEESGQTSRDDASSSAADGDAAQRARAFEDFIDSVGPHMRSLVFTCSRTLKNLRTTFTTRTVGTPKQAPTSNAGVHEPLLGSRFRSGDSFDLLLHDVSAALGRFQHEQTVAIKRIYTMEPKKAEAQRQAAEYASRQSQSDSGQEGHAELPISRIHPDEEIFLIFFFVFNLEEFAKELATLVETLELLRKREEQLATARATSILASTKLWFATVASSWKSFTRRLRRPRSASRWARRDRRKTTGVLDFPSNRRHTINTGQTPAAFTLKQRFQRLVWNVGEFLRQADTKFAIKAGAGSAILASPAFFESTRPTFKKFQGQWALVSFMVVLSPTLGQSNQMSLHRFLGTITGAAAAVGIYKLFPDNSTVLPIFGIFFSLPCFRYIVGKPQLASSGRFVLLTYNLTALYSYNLRKTEVEVEQIAVQRTISVLVGVLWATMLNQLIWPFEARRELARGVSDLIFKLAWLYQRLVVSYSEDQSRLAHRADMDGNADGREDADLTDDDCEEQPLLQSHQSAAGEEFQAIELHLQVAIIKLEGLLAQTKHEPRLKGPFPVATYKAMLVCCQNILDKLHSIKVVTSRDDWYAVVRRDFVIPVNAERREMVGNVLLFFYTLGSAFHLKIPVPPYFPPASACRLRLLEKIRELPVVKRRVIRGSSAYLLFYSYALAMGDVIEQLEELGRLTQHNFGVWGNSVQDFERHFRASPESMDPTPYGSLRGWVGTRRGP